MALIVQFYDAGDMVRSKTHGPFVGLRVYDGVLYASPSAGTTLSLAKCLAGPSHETDRWWPEGENRGYTDFLVS